jgi:FtsP/CotA-like multicopper oxidase with cupredoxin domain
LLSLPRSDWDKNQLLPFVPVSTSATEPIWVDLVINNLDDGSHPFHLHGHSFYVLSSFRADVGGGWGSWSPYSGKPLPGGINTETPLLKDTIPVPRRGHVLLRLQAGQPGLWMLHCHMLVHLGSGMAAGIHVGHEGDEAHVLAADESAAELCAAN